MIVGAGQAGTQLALGLLPIGYEVSLVSSRTPDQIRSGRVMSTQCMFDTALQHERDLGLNFWESEAPAIEALGVAIAGSEGTRKVAWTGKLDHYAQSVDQRIKIATWLEEFEARGGNLIIQDPSSHELDTLSANQDLVLVASGRGGLASLFARNHACSPFLGPQRDLAVAYVHGLEPHPEQPQLESVRFNIVPGAGELFIIPTLTMSGRADILFWESVLGGPLDVFGGAESPAEHLSKMLGLMREYVPWEHARAREVELCDTEATLTGRIAPTVRHPIAELPSGRPVLGMADTVVANDPITGQGANNAAKCAAIYLQAIVAHDGSAFDRHWMNHTFQSFWCEVRSSTEWTNALLGPPPEHVLELLGAAEQLPNVARRFVNGFNNPADFGSYFFDAEKTARWLDSARQAA